MDGKTQPVLHNMDIEETRGADDIIAKHLNDATRVATFAMGGILPIMDIASTYLGLNCECHIFPGLNWRSKDPNPRELFRTWIEGLSENERVVIFDTGRVGNAMGTILGVLKEVEIRCQVIAVVILAEHARFVEPSSSNETFAKSRNILLIPVLIDKNLFEDKLDLMGYEVSRHQGWIKPLEGINVVCFENPDGRALVMGPQPATLLKMLRPSGAMSGALRAATRSKL